MANSGEIAVEKGINSVSLIVVETFWLRNSGLLIRLVKGFTEAGLTVNSVKFLALEAHNGCRVGNLKPRARKKRKRRS